MIQHTNQSSDGLIEEEGYNPCPLVIVKMIKTLVEPSKLGGELLDNCAGDGFTGTFLAKAWNLKPFLVEPNLERAKSCARRKKSISLCGKAENIQLKGCPSVWYFNPPFDPDDPKGLLERQIFLQSLMYAKKPGTLGILLFFVDSFIKTDLAYDIAYNFSNITLRKFPEPYFSDFRQIVLFGYGKNTTLRKSKVMNLVSRLRQIAEDKSELYFLKAHEFKYLIPEASAPIEEFSLNNFSQNMR